jgi:three-Cys-motif partner protein
MKKGIFYQTPSDASRVKQAIVTTYFGAWKNVLKTWRNAPTLGYVDLYSGPGVYADGSFSTPLLILRQALEDDYLVNKLATTFNDGDPELAAELRLNIAKIPGIERLHNPPKVYEYSVSERVIRLAPNFPTLLFADPWGYKGLSIGLIARFLSVAGSDCIFFFNYNRISAGLGWKGFDEPLDAVFGRARAEALRLRIRGLSSSQREREIVSEMQGALKEIGARCALPFRFISEKADRTSHHLLFASKNPRGCLIMKDVMRKRSSTLIQGIGTFEFTGTTSDSEQLMFPGLGPLDDLQAYLLRKFEGQKLTFDELLSRDDHPTAAERNYKDAILQLEAEGTVTIEVPGRERRQSKGNLTLPNDAIISFRAKGEPHGGEFEH